MARFLYHDFHPSARKGYMLYLALCWSAGLIAGCAMAASAEPSVISLMRMAVFGPVSIVGLLGVTLLPLLCSALAVYLSRPFLLLAAGFCKACFFGFIAFAVRIAFGNAGWVYQQLLMFCDACTLPMLYCFALRHSPERCCLRPADWLFVLWGIAVAVADFLLISPLLPEF